MNIPIFVFDIEERLERLKTLPVPILKNFTVYLDCTIGGMRTDLEPSKGGKRQIIEWTPIIKTKRSKEKHSWQCKSWTSECNFHFHAIMLADDENYCLAYIMPLEKRSFNGLLINDLEKHDTLNVSIIVDTWVFKAAKGKTHTLIIRGNNVL